MEEDLKKLIAEFRNAAAILHQQEGEAAKQGLYFNQGEACGRACAYEQAANQIEFILRGTLAQKVKNA
jgi:hypothetical protein